MLLAESQILARCLASQSSALIGKTVIFGHERGSSLLYVGDFELLTKLRTVQIGNGVVILDGLVASGPVKSGRTSHI